MLNMSSSVICKPVASVSIPIDSLNEFSISLITLVKPSLRLTDGSHPMDLILDISKFFL